MLKGEKKKCQMKDRRLSIFMIVDFFNFRKLSRNIT